MTYLGHIAFRELVAAYGGYGLLFSEMCSARRLPRENREHSHFFRWRDDELSGLVCQIVGSETGAMQHAARIIEQNGFFGVDINLGCSTTAICKQNCGAALLKEPSQALRIAAAVRKAISIPLFVKFRTGWRDDPQPAVELARRLEDVGVDALTFHPRVAPDRRARPPKWDYIARVKEAVSIPVFGNGDVFTRDDCLRILQTTGCDGVALGRMGIARPWIFAQWRGLLTPQPSIYLEAALSLIALLRRYYEPIPAMRRFRRFALYFCANFRFGHTLYTRIHNVTDMDALPAVLHTFFQQSPELTSRPNLNMFQ
jgi:nifR3 family TIM-barrel protein